ncbi:MAG: DEAD/DEAH box helicase [Rickettsiales bacterium]|nr:MAG: DEAD/DEAH box helicase [Rickettsiales bacterium]
MSSFDLLHPTIQKAVYKMGWTNFRVIQDEAIQILSPNPNDLIISAPTASGKTEACFLPIISNIINNKVDGIKILYISPLKALINDQFVRIEKLCEELRFPIVKWHGDANQQAKIEMLKNPDGILLITPESIEAMFINRYREVEKLFKNLEYVVIDEVHIFIDSPRGNHLFSLLNRIEKIINKKVCKIALSATINDESPIKKWLNYDNPESVKFIKSDDNINTGLFGEIKGYYRKEYNAELLKDMFEAIKCNKNLIFADSKNMLERYCLNIKKLAKANKILDRFFIHHGSLAKEIREIVEIKLKNDNDISVFCTSTLELGIDIGDIDKIIFLSAPHKVSSTIQRLGRSGRKENSNRNFKMFIEESPIDEKSTFQDKLRINMIRGISVIELLAREKWCEPLQINIDYSTILHQILSYLGGTGGASIEKIYNTIIVEAFKNCITQGKFLELVKSLRDKKIIYQSSSGSISLTEGGENLVHNYKFYPSFMADDNYEVNFNGNIIGFINVDAVVIQVGDSILMDGKQWQILEIINSNKKILVRHSKEGKAIFTSSGLVEENIKIHQKMREIYEGKITNIPYIDKNANELLKEGIFNYDLIKNQFLPVFGGSKVQNTISFMLSNVLSETDINLVQELGVGFYCFNGKEFLIEVLKKADFSYKFFYDCLNKKDKEHIAKNNKLDYLLSKDLLIEEYIKNNFDIGYFNKLIT